jgi:predicted PurR-regulated permease PerM
VLVLLLVFGLFGGALYWSGELIAGKAPQYQGKIQELQRQADAWARGHGFSLPRPGTTGGSGEIARLAIKTAYTSGSTILLILALTILGLFEVHDFRRKAERGFRHPEHGAQLIESSRAIAARFQQYLVARTLAAVLQGLTCGLFAWVIGLDLAFVWGLTAFLLNYLPTIGSALAVVPPTLFALFQFGASGRAAAVFLGMAALQILLGNYVDPLIQGRYLSLSPVVVLVSIVFWGWIWGLGGALLGVPITVGLVIAADHFPQTRWIARLLARKPEGADM